MGRVADPIGVGIPGTSDASTACLPPSSSIGQVDVETRGQGIQVRGQGIQVDVETKGQGSRMRSLVRAVAVLSLGGAAVCASPALGSFPGQNGRIAFGSERHGGDMDIWTMRADGSGAVNLTADSSEGDDAPNWRADGRRIAFMSNRVNAENPTGDYEIFVMRADGTRQRQLTSNLLDDEDPAWSPDGKVITIQRDFQPEQGEIDYDLINLAADGTGETNLTNSPGIDDVSPNWSPDGRSIAFASTRDGDDEVFRMKPDGSDAQQLTSNKDSFDGHPTWSPDGRRIGFESDRNGRKFPDLFTMRADGSRERLLASSKRFDVFMAWSPDGRRIAFNSDRDGDPEVFVMGANRGSRQRKLTRNDVADLFPDWQPVRRAGSRRRGR